MTNDELFEFHRVLLTGIFVARVREGEDHEDLVAILADPEDPTMPEALREALEMEGEEEDYQARVMPLPGVYNPPREAPASDEPLPDGNKVLLRTHLRMGTLYREELREVLLEEHPELAMALDQPTKLNRVPCLVLAGRRLSLHRLVVQMMRWTAGGDA